MKRAIYLFVLLLTACSNVEMKQPASRQMTLALNIPPLASASEQNLSRKLMRSGTLTFQVVNVRDAHDSIKYFMHAFNAYAASENQELLGSSLRHHMEIRVDEIHFDALMAKIESVAKVINHRHIETEDVTAEYLDLNARLKTKKKLESRYHEILGYARTVKDILSIEEQIGSTRADIESMEGRLKYLTNKVSYGTIAVTFSENRTFKDPTFLSRIADSMQRGWQELLRFALLLVSFWPWLIVVTAIIITAKRYWRKGRTKAQAVS